MSAEWIERQLKGKDVLVLPMGDGSGEYVIYRVPGWREAPRRRARIALIRLHRRIERWWRS
jgi:hypothetical protein